MKIGFIGVGVMGRPMCLHLINKGFEVEIFARDANKVKDLIDNGIKFHSSIASLAKKMDVIITMVGYPKDVEDVYFGKDMIFDNANKGTVLIDMTTSSPSLAQKIALESEKRGLHSLDAPVTGGDSGAKNATLTIFVGGEETIYQKMLPIFQAMGKTIAYVGPAGYGQHAKLANQIAIAGAVSAMAEMITYARVNGLDVEKVLPLWSSGSASSWQMQNMAPRAIKGDLKPGFYIKHFIKDMKLAVNESKQHNLDLKMLNTVLAMFEDFANQGNSELGTQAIINYYQKETKK